jgi:sulfide:quinone oxidoreductase
MIVSLNVVREKGFCMDATTTVILGGGFGGLATATTLRRLLPDQHEIILLDEADRFTVGAGKTWVMLGEKSVEEVSRLRAELVPPGVRFVQSPILQFDAQEGTVVTSSATYQAGYLVIALGADYNMQAVPGLHAAAHSFYTPEDAVVLREVLQRFAGGRILFLIPRRPFKCPPAPYEAALLLHHSLTRRGLMEKSQIDLYTFEGAPMATAGVDAGQFIRNEMSRVGVGYYPGKQTRSVDGARQAVEFADGSEAPYDLLIAVPPHEAPQVVRAAGLAKPGGWIEVDPLTLRVAAASGRCPVYAIGDVAEVALPGRYKPDMPLVLPKAGVFAGAQGHVVATQIAAQITGEPVAEIFGGAGYCFLETEPGIALKGEGDFFALPHPVNVSHQPDSRQFEDKVKWINGWLQRA